MHSFQGAQHSCICMYLFNLPLASNTKTTTFQNCTSSSNSEVKLYTYIQSFFWEFLRCAPGMIAESPSQPELF